MSTQWLPNLQRILMAARTYKRACGHLRQAQRDIDRVGGWVPADESNIGNIFQERWWRARQAKLAAADRLLYFVETGEKSYPSGRTTR